jgi:hypothetical protein
MSMSCADRWRYLLIAVALAFVSGCGGGNSSQTTIVGGGISGGVGATTVASDAPTGPNTTQIVVDSGPDSGFSLGAVNIPYVTLTVCSPGSLTACASIDHVFLDTGSIGLRLLKSKAQSLSLPAVMIPAASATATPAGAAAECYPFVLGAVWGSLATADLRIGGELASGITVQLIDDSTPAVPSVPDACLSASNGELLTSVASLQANGILGVGMIAYDCGLICSTGDYSSGYTLYYSCPGASGASCVPAAIPTTLQIQNPVVHFAVNNNGTMITLPALPDLGAGSASGRLVFGIGTQSNNQLPVAAKMYLVDANPSSPSYLFFSTTVGNTNYPDSYVDSGSNALFFDDTSIAKGCQSSSGSTGGWYCPSAVLRRNATITDSSGTTGPIDYSVANADVLFTTSSLAFADLAGAAGQGAATFVWGLPFFFGRTVFTSIWGQALSPKGPWNAF